jgi:hypothetical protein
MYKIKINLPCYLEENEFITPDKHRLADFIKDKITELDNRDPDWHIFITTTKIGYLWEYTE